MFSICPSRNLDALVHKDFKATTVQQLIKASIERYCNKLDTHPNQTAIVINNILIILKQLNQKVLIKKF